MDASMTERVSVLIEKFNFLLHKNHSLLSSKKICSNIVFCDALYSHSSSSLKVYRVKWLNDETNIVKRMQIRCNSCCCLPDHNLTPLTAHTSRCDFQHQQSERFNCHMQRCNTMPNLYAKINQSGETTIYLRHFENHKRKLNNWRWKTQS